jgi:hypothetical protein
MKLIKQQNTLGRTCKYRGCKNFVPLKNGLLCTKHRKQKQRKNSPLIYFYERFLYNRRKMNILVSLNYFQYLTIWNNNEKILKQRIRGKKTYDLMPLNKNLPISVNNYFFPNNKKPKK